MCEKLTRKEAKELSLEAWRYLRDNPEIDTKSGLPSEIFNKITGFWFSCPLCELFHNALVSLVENCCTGCPLSIRSCVSLESPYARWARSIMNETRREAAAEIVSIIEAWEPEEE
jgi:hypothetical protein